MPIFFFPCQIWLKKGSAIQKKTSIEVEKIQNVFRYLIEYCAYVQAASYERI